MLKSIQLKKEQIDFQDNVVDVLWPEKKIVIAIAALITPAMNKSNKANINILRPVFLLPIFNYTHVLVRMVLILWISI